LRTNGGSFYTAGHPAAILTPGFAAFTPFGLVPEILLVVKLLLAGGKNEVCPAIDALENAILKFDHGTHPCYPSLLWNGKGEAVAMPLRPLGLFDLPATLLPVPLAGKRCLNPLFLARLQIERMPLDLFNDVFLLHFSFEAAEGVFQRFPLL
jgi:hypothetical protein